MIKESVCNVTTVNSTVLQCIVGEHAGGIFPVMMRHKTKGSAVSSVVFEYPLSIQNIYPIQGDQTVYIISALIWKQHNLKALP